MLKPGFILLLLLSLLLNNVNAAVEAETQLAFLPEQQVLAQLPQLQQQAAADNKLLLLVLGANWCHDSVALLQQFAKAEFQQALQQRFVLALVDVGYLEYGQATANRYGLPLYYATPTVMVIAPRNGQLLNKMDLLHWSNAASFDLAAYQQYFLSHDFQQQFAHQQQQLAAVNPQQLAQIAQYEQQQAAKLAQEYQRLGPLLKAYKASGLPASAEFRQAWDEVKALRTAILPTVEQLQQQAIKAEPLPL